MKHINFKLLNFPYTVLSEDISPLPPPPDDAIFRILPDGTYRTTFLTLTEEADRVVDITP